MERSFGAILMIFILVSADSWAKKASLSWAAPNLFICTVKQAAETQQEAGRAGEIQQGFRLKKKKSIPETSNEQN